MGYYSSRQTTIRFEFSAAPADGLVIGPGPADLTIGETNAENREHIRKTNRGAFNGHVQGDDIEQECSITVELENQSQTHATLARVRDFINKQGLYSAGTSLSLDVWAWRAIVTMNDGITISTCTLNHCDGGYAFSEAKEGNSFAITFRNNAAVVWT